MTLPRRSIRSYVIRQGRLTSAQARVLEHQPSPFLLQPQTLTAVCEARALNRPLCLEIGIGNGDNLVHQAQSTPAGLFIGCDVHRPGLGHALLSVERLGLKNAYIVEADVFEVFAALQRQSLDRVSMFFPDPWPKKRHHKRRLLNQAFLRDMADRIATHGRFFFCTDDEDYAAAAATAIEQTKGWLNLAGASAYAPRPFQRIRTRFEQRARAAGKPIYELVAARTA